MWIVVFWAATPFNLVCVYKRFGRTYRLHLQDKNEALEDTPPGVASITLKMEAFRSSQMLVLHGITAQIAAIPTTTLYFNVLPSIIPTKRPCELMR
jgi:hypothetical protein